MKALIEILEALLLVSTFFFIICLVMAMYHIGEFVGNTIVWCIHWIEQF